MCALAKKKIHRDGIHCCHVWKIADRMDLISMPESFVQYRWTKLADQDISLAAGQEMIVGGSKTSDAIQYCIMMADVSQFCSTIAGNKQAIELFAKEFEELKTRINTNLKFKKTTMRRM